MEVVEVGKQNEEGKRPGRVFSENGMKVYDVEILGVELGDESIEELLLSAQRSVVNQTLELEAEHRKLKLVRETERVRQQIQEIQTETKLQEMEQELLRLQKKHMLQITLPVSRFLR